MRGRTSLAAWASLLFVPDRFFEDRTLRAAASGRVVVGVAALYALGYLGVLVAGAVVAALKHDRFGIVENLLDLHPGVYAACILVGTLVLVNWLVVGTVLHVAIKVGNGGGTVGDTLSVVAWTSPVTLLVPLLWGAGFLLAVWGSPLVMTYDASVVTALPTARLAGTGGAVLALLWQGRLWPAGLRHAHEVTHRTSSRAAAATVVLAVLTLLVAT